MELNRQKKLFRVLVVIFFISLGYRVINPFEQRQVKELTYTGRTGKQTTDRKKPSASHDPLSFNVMISLLENPPEHSAKVISQHFFQQIPGAEQHLSPAPQGDESGLDFEDDELNEPSMHQDPKMALIERIHQLKVIGMFVRGKEAAVFFPKGKTEHCRP